MHVMTVFASFSGNNTWFGALLGIHIVGAIVGLGPTFAFGIMAATSKKVSPERSLGILEATMAVENKLATPVLTTVQLLTGVLLIVNRNLHKNFFRGTNAWLIIALVVYVVALGIVHGVMNPTMKKMLAMGNAGEGGTPAFGAVAKKLDIFGPVLTLLGLTIMVLMIWRPGSGCGVPGVC